MSTTLTKAGRQFLDTNFLLHNETAEFLYHAHVKALPVIDYHNHLNPEHLADNKMFETITELWIQGDPYKHRAMRINGVPESSITGKASPKEKFMAWAATVPYTVGNPLFHWSALELKTIFGVESILTPANAGDVWEACNKVLLGHDFGSADIARRFNVQTVCTSDDLLQSLEPHRRASAQSGFDVLPSLRADPIVQPGAAFIKKLEQRAGTAVRTLDDYKSAVSQLLGEFVRAGCRLGDIALDAGFRFGGLAPGAEAVFSRVIADDASVSTAEAHGLRDHLLVFIAAEFHRLGWIMQLHIGAQRRTSSRLRRLTGPSGGYASIGNSCDVTSIIQLIDLLEERETLPRTILYPLNRADYEPLGTLTGSFTEEGVQSKVQLGPAWWYNDHYEGIRDHLLKLANHGLLRTFIGMTTDSRSVLSLSRHEYFRRILCNLVGEWVSRGELPDDKSLLTQLVEDISYNNIKKWISA